MAINGIDPTGRAAAEALRALEERREEDGPEAEVGVDAAAEERRRAAEVAGTIGDSVKEAAKGATAREAADSADSADGISESRASSGEALHQEAVETASAQQDRGEDWQEFAGREEERELPPTVEEQARETEEDRARNEEVKVADLLKEIAIGSGKIPS